MAFGRITGLAVRFAARPYPSVSAMDRETLPHLGGSCVDLITSLPDAAQGVSHGGVPHYMGVVPMPLVRRTWLFPKTVEKCEEVALIWAG